MPILADHPFDSNTRKLQKHLLHLIQAIQDDIHEPHLRHIEGIAETICVRRCGVRREAICQRCPVERRMSRLGEMS